MVAYPAISGETAVTTHQFEALEWFTERIFYLGHSGNNLHFAMDGGDSLHEDRLEYDAVCPSRKVWDLGELVEEPVKGQHHKITSPPPKKRMLNLSVITEV